MADFEVRPGNDLAAIVNGASAGSLVEIYPGTYEAGELTPANGVRLVGVGAELGPEGNVIAPAQIIGRGPNIVNLNLVDGAQIIGLDLSGGVYTPGDGQTGNGVMHGSNTTIRLTRIHDTPKAGLSGLLDNLLIEDSELDHNATEQPSGLGAALKTTRFVTIRRVFVHDNHYYGLWTDCQCPGWVVEDCRVVDNFGTGIFNEISIGQSLIQRNYIANNNTGADAGRSDVVVTSSRRVRLYRNVIATEGTGRVLWIREDDRAGNNDPGDPNYIGEQSNCLQGHRLDEIEVLENAILSGHVRVQFNSGTSDQVDHLTDQVVTNPFDTTAPAIGIRFAGNVTDPVLLGRRGRRGGVHVGITVGL